MLNNLSIAGCPSTAGEQRTQKQRRQSTSLFPTTSLLASVKILEQRSEILRRVARRRVFCHVRDMFVSFAVQIYLQSQTRSLQVATNRSTVIDQAPGMMHDTLEGIVSTRNSYLGHNQCKKNHLNDSGTVTMPTDLGFRGSSNF